MTAAEPLDLGGRREQTAAADGAVAFQASAKAIVLGRPQRDASIARHAVEEVLHRRTNEDTTRQNCPKALLSTPPPSPNPTALKITK